MIIGYLLSGDDNDSFMLDDEKNPDAPVCSNCGYLLNFNYHNPFFKLKRKVYDFSYTYDGHCIVSLKFKEFCLRENYGHLEFKEFEREPNFFQLIVNNVVPFDTLNAKTEFGKKCPVCGNYDYTVGFEPIHLLGINEELSAGFCRSDILFGSYNRKSPLVVVAPITQIKLRKEKLKGLIFHSVSS